MYIELRRGNTRVYVNEDNISHIFDERDPKGNRVVVVTKSGLTFEKIITTNYEVAKWQEFVDGLNMVTVPIKF